MAKVIVVEYGPKKEIRDEPVYPKPARYLEFYQHQRSNGRERGRLSGICSGAIAIVRSDDERTYIVKARRKRRIDRCAFPVTSENYER